MSLSSSARTRLGIRTAMAVVAVAGLLLIENDTALLLFLVAICVLALSISHLIGESPEEAEGAGFYVPVVGAIVVSALVFEDEQRMLASVIVLVLLFRVAWDATRTARSQRSA